MPVQFLTTMWSVLREARKSSPVALDEIVRRYRGPVYEYLRQRGLQDADADDLVQEVFVRACSESFLARADASKGRFRTLLLAVANHVLASDWRARLAAKRGGGAGVASLEQGNGDVFAMVQPAGADVRDDVYHRLWAENLVKEAVEKLQVREDQHRAITLFYFDGKTQREIADALGCKEKDVENMLADARKRMRRWISEAIEEYTSSRREYEQEIAELSRHL
jgi:RNA polymerase sigma-70 factor (ECF subfamily)